MYNSLDKQSVKQNTPIVAIGGCGQAAAHKPIIQISQIDYLSSSKWCEVELLW